MGSLGLSDELLDEVLYTIFDDMLRVLCELLYRLLGETLNDILYRRMCIVY